MLLLTSVVVLEQFHFVIYYTYIKNEHKNTFNETWTDKASIVMVSHSSDWYSTFTTKNLRSE